MIIGVSSHSFRKMLVDKDITHIGLIKKAKDMGFSVIEYVDRCEFEEITLDNAHIYKEEAEKHDMKIVCFTLGADFLGDFDAEVERLCKKAEVAAALGAGLMRHDASGGTNEKYRTFDDALPVIASGCRLVTEHAEKYGVKTMVENHGYFCQDALRVEKLVHEVNHKNFGLLVDMGNFLCADNDPVLSMSVCSKYAYHVHAKDLIVKNGNQPDPGDGFFTTRGGNFLRGTIIGHGNVPVVQCLRALKKSDYNGYVMIEFEGCEPCEYSIKTSYDNIKRYVSMI